MQRMTGIDPMFIYSDTPETPMEIAYACVFDPSSAPDGYSFEKVRALLDGADPHAALVPPPPHGGAARSRPPAVGGRPRIRHRQPPAPGGCCRPRADRGVQRHGRRRHGAAPHAGAAAVGDARDRGPGRRQGRLDRQGAPLRDRRRGRCAAARPAPRPQPRGPGGDRDLPALAAAAPARRTPHWSPTRCPAWCRARCACCGRPAKWAGRRSGWPGGRSTRPPGPISIPLGAPDTFELPVGAQRAVSFAELDLAQVRTLKDRYGSTINDVVLAVCSGALRTHLMASGQDTEQPAGGDRAGLGPG